MVKVTGYGLDFARAVGERGSMRYLDSTSVAGIVVYTGYYHQGRIFNTDTAIRRETCVV